MGVDIGEAGYRGHVAAGLVGDIAERNRGRGLEHERVHAQTARDLELAGVVGDHIVGAAADDGVEAAAAVDGVGAVAAGDGVGGARAGDGQRARDARRVYVLEVVDSDGVAGRFILSSGHRKVDDGDAARRSELQRIVPRPAVDGDFGPVVEHKIVAGPGVDRICAAIAVDGVGAAAAKQAVGAGVAGQRDADQQRRGVNVCEIENAGRVARGLIRGAREIDRHSRGELQRVYARSAVDQRFASMIGYEVVPGAGVDRVDAAAAVDGVVARAGRNHIRAGRAVNGQRRRNQRGVQVLEIGDKNRAAGGLVGAGRDIEIDARHAACGQHLQRVRGTAAAVEGRFRSVIGDEVVAGAGQDRVQAAAAVQSFAAAAAEDAIGAARTRDRVRDIEKMRIDILEIHHDRRNPDDLVSGREIHSDSRRQHQRVAFIRRAAVKGGFGSVIVHGVVAGSGQDRVEPAVAVDRVVATAAAQQIGSIRTRKRNTRA